MKTYYSIGETAKLASTTIETLRHYDRISLLKPAKVDSHSGYRYYSDKELVYLNVINFCKQKNMPLNIIKDVFTNDSFEYIIDFLKLTEDKIDEEIKQLHKTKLQLLSLREQYESQKLLSPEQLSDNSFSSKQIEQRVIVKIHSLQQPSIENFNQMQEIVYHQIGDSMRNQFVFDQSANIITTFEPTGSQSAFFSVCEKYPALADGISILPKGEYLYGFCSEEQRNVAIENMIKHARNEYGIEIPFIIQSIIFTGMFQWVYEIQALLECN
ncbi:MerR family transcriptional regulator [Paenibacillus glacialis]|uniref:HTH merR-type domain-containing protein n=1 Tax=Paenibacillus glacialis TaxID=494026 RepID=A0A168KFM5_9BACL|nr:MerR family transcriptional regulator [Paenibacillus glacialis]OAB41940.1 hypothetical protein PGLA_14030 [Paenibacillus glacialis]